MTPCDKERFIRTKVNEHLIGEGEKIMWSLHAVVAVDQDFDRILVITVYRPDQRRWQDGWRRRKEDD